LLLLLLLYLQNPSNPSCSYDCQQPAAMLMQTAPLLAIQPDWPLLLLLLLLLLLPYRTPATPAAILNARTLTASSSSSPYRAFGAL
jgi:hypothetical protein